MLYFIHGNKRKVFRLNKIRVIPINLKDGKSLLKFEIENRSFFEESCLSRGDEYYEEERFIHILKELIEEQEQGMHYMYLIKDDEDQIIGRINLVNIIRGNFNKAELGYRIGRKYNGKGYAKKAVEIILKEAKDVHMFHRIEAGTSYFNIPSQIVLEHNGFRKVGVYNKFIYLNGNWEDSIIYEMILI